MSDEKLPVPAGKRGEEPSLLRRLTMTWTAEGQLRETVRELERQARLEGYRARMKAVLEAERTLLSAGVAKAAQTAETLRQEWHSRQVRLRSSAADREEGLLLAAFLQKLEALDKLAARLPVEIVDALKERALEEFTRAANRIRQGGGA